MKLLKIGLGILFFINLIFFATPIFLDDQYDVNYTKEFSSTMHSTVFELLADFKRHKEWNPWFQNDSNVKFEISEPSRGLGAYYKWDSDGHGSGVQKVTQFKEGEFMEVIFDSGDQGQAHASFIFKIEGESLFVTWRMWGSSNGYVGRYMSHFMDDMMIPVMTAGLNNLAKTAATQ